MKLYIKYQRPGPSSFKEEHFNVFPVWEYVKQVITGMGGHFGLRAMIWTIFVEDYNI